MCDIATLHCSMHNNFTVQSLHHMNVCIFYLKQIIIYDSWSLILLGSASLSSSPGQINGVVTACRSEPISLTCTHNNTITGNTRWVVGPPVDCAKTISSSVPPGQSCEPIISFQDVSVLSEGIVSSRATVNTANTSVNSTVLECRDGAGILFNTVGNVSICILG